jgi:putative ABC transport system ATP-binding protein
MFKRWFSRSKQPGNETNGRYKHGNDHLIELRRVVKTYHTAAGDFVALKDVDLQVDPGEFVAVIGKSGSGKSTLINMITGIDRPTAGQVLVGDTAVHELNEGQIAVWRGRQVGVVFQFFQLLPTLTLVENVMLPMDFCDMYSMPEREERAMTLLAQVDLTDHAHKLPTAISGGQQQRAAIARALANDPPILAADEPTGNLDSVTSASIFNLFEDLIAKGKTILMVTHDLDLARRATRTILLVDGEIADGLDELEAVAVGAPQSPVAPGETTRAED